MLLALGDGRALPAGELAYAARVSPQTASGHLARLAGAGLLSVVSQGRHRYYRLASARVGALLEAALAVAADAPPRRTVPGRMDEALRAGRTCYNHLERQRDSRAVRVTVVGVTGLRSVFGVTLDAPAEDGMLRSA